MTTMPEEKIPERLCQAVIDLWTEKFLTGVEKLRITVCSGSVELQMDIAFTVKKNDAKAHAQLLELGKQLFWEKSDENMESDIKGNSNGCRGTCNGA